MVKTRKGFYHQDSGRTLQAAVRERKGECLERNGKEATLIMQS